MLPTFLILGAPKCGTTTLYEWLSMRQDVFMPGDKDPIFFEADDEYVRGPEFYRDTYFSEWRGEPVVGEARASKLMLPYVPARIHRILPGARLVAMVRDPVDRLVSHWWMRTCNGNETLPLEEAIRRNLEALETGRSFAGERGASEWRRRLDDDPGLAPVYLEFGYYAEQLERYFELFPRSRVKVLFLEDMQHRPAALMRELLEFLDADPVPPHRSWPVHNAALPTALRPLIELDRRMGVLGALPGRWKRVVKRIVSRRGAHPPADEPLKRRIAKHYAPHNEALVELTGRDLSHWTS